MKEEFEFYKIEISAEYYKRCIKLITPDMTVSGHKTIQRQSVNIWDLDACVISKVRTTILKQSQLTKDTLNIVVGTKYTNNTYFYILEPISVTDNKQWTTDYYFNSIKSVKYLFEVKRENGDIVSWIEEKELRPKETTEFNIEF